MYAEDVKQVSAVTQGAITLSATTNGPTIDTQGHESLAFLIAVGDFVTFDGTNNLAIKVQEGDQSDGSDAADIAAADYLTARNEAGAAWDRLLNAAAEDEESYVLGVKLGTKRYRRLVITEAGIVSVVFAAVAVLGRARHKPAVAAQLP